MYFFCLVVPASRVVPGWLLSPVFSYSFLYFLCYFIIWRISKFQYKFKYK